MEEGTLLFCGFTEFPTRTVYLCGYALLFICCFGLFGNCICLTSVIKRYLGDTVFRVYLYHLCVADTITLVSCIFMLVVPILTDQSDSGADVRSLVNYFILFWYPIGTFTEHISTQITAAISVVRLLSVKYPLQMRSFRSPRKAASVVAMLVVFVTLFHIPRLLELNIHYCVANVNGHNSTLATIGTTSLRNSQYYKTVYMTYSNIAVMFVLPFVTILVCNCATMIILMRSGHVSPHWRSNDSRFERKKMTSKLLIFICLSFLLCHSLPFLVNFVETMEWNREELGDTYSLLVDISNFLVAVKASGNIFVYLLFNRKFRSAVSHVDRVAPHFGRTVAIESGNRLTTVSDLEFVCRKNRKNN